MLLAIATTAQENRNEMKRNFNSIDVLFSGQKNENLMSKEKKKKKKKEETNIK